MTDTNQHNTSTAQSAKQAGAEAADKIQDKAQDAAGKVSEHMTDAADKTRSGAARNVKQMAEALHTASDQLDDNSTQRRMFDVVADNLEQVSDALTRKDMGEMMRDLNQMARKHPFAFLGGAALVGFAATRLMTAGASDGGHRAQGATTQQARDDARHPLPTSATGTPTTGV
ncbi:MULTISPECIES: hypothetical protein [unclassified Yoonia]|uniref:hypothetical protein n=1 Tax=unclassified Yoonia TaxID=2629118 RepID=UPI002AFFC75E|nr:MULTISPECIES: hypothetical protein [unclassified Yoonia]